jgi:hypothetical protein
LVYKTIKICDGHFYGQNGQKSVKLTFLHGYGTPKCNLIVIGNNEGTLIYLCGWDA